MRAGQIFIVGVVRSRFFILLYLLLHKNALGHGFRVRVLGMSHHSHTTLKVSVSLTDYNNHLCVLGSLTRLHHRPPPYNVTPVHTLGPFLVDSILG